MEFALRSDICQDSCLLLSLTDVSGWKKTSAAIILTLQIQVNCFFILALATSNMQCFLDSWVITALKYAICFSRLSGQKTLILEHSLIL